ncbi:ATP-binding sensor histidine kinase [Nannocystis sp.]|uniref:trifunctional serine/threonine-protein kinase/ATP-binding protein/sensor histidine kinase n=1 Tax=Nannocystis sp. TaxID=1962667 RepID=UPI0025D798FB|nr:ATP-binding sensor histidine kinase [Nannocystis sp.]MBK7830047.1 AAA family ATPase [Nannocystis sp.]
MITVPGYLVSRVLREGRRTMLLRATRLADGAAVVLKALRGEHPGTRDLARLRHEHEVLARFNDPCVIRTHGLIELGTRAVLVMEDFVGTTLAERLPPAGLPLAEFLVIAPRLVRALTVIHERDVIHHNLNPGNILVDATLQRVTLVDFSLASALAEEHSELAARELSGGSLTYISPEQTGRMNRPVDYRSDIYALGITFYQLLTGAPPFTFADPLELVHAHIARLPAPVHERRPEVPPALSALVLRMLAKNAEARYQSSAGLLADLERVRRALEGRGPVDFPLGELDFSDRFILPSNLHGREPDAAALLAAFARTCAGGNELVLLAGPPGIGKSVLVREIHRPMVLHRGHFCSGKFDQLGRNSPYSALAQALRGLMLHILGEQDARLLDWRATLSVALAPNARVLFDTVPELERLLEPQPSVPVLPPTESANRFHTALRALLRALAGERHPVAIFLDDLQWTDPATCKLVEELVGDAELTHILWIGAYRDTEVDLDHPLARALRRLDERGAAVTVRALPPLAPASVARIIADTLHCGPDDAAALAALIHDRSEGNPMFVRTYLQSLHDQGVLTLDRSCGAWTWTAARLSQAALPDDVVDLVTRRISELPPRARDLLRVAACCGGRFDLHLVARIEGAATPGVLADLWPAVDRGLLRPVGDDYKYVADERHAAELEFVHDRIQQVAYAQILADERPRLHLTVGRTLLALSDHARSQSEVFTIAGHLSRAGAMLDDPGERLRVAAIHLRAARQAKAATAYRSACGYLNAGIELLPADVWTSAYPLAFALHRELVECAYLAGDPEAAIAVFTPLLERACTRREKAELHALRAVLETNRGKLRAALAAGRAGLALFAVELPELATPADVVLAFEAYQALRADLSDEALRSWPETRDEDIRVEMRVMVAMSAAAYFTDTNLASLLLLRIAIHSLRHGLSEVSSYGMIGVGLVLSGGFGRYTDGDAHGRLAHDLNERFANAELRPRIALFWATFMMAWTRPFAEVQATLADAAESGLQVGDFIYAVYCTVTTVFLTVLTGEPLDRLQERIEVSLALVRRRELLDQILVLGHMRCLFAALADPAATPVNTAPLRAGMDDAHAPLAMFYSHYYEALIAYLHNDTQAAHAALVEAQPRVTVAFGSSMVADFTFLECLILARRHADADADERAAITEKIENNLNRLAAWALSAPCNFAHREALARGEWARAQGDDGGALRNYNQAIDLAREHGAPHLEAIACECALRFAAARAFPILVHAYLQAALAAYRTWGAHAQATRLTREFAEATRSTGAPDAAHTSGAESATGLHTLDHASLVKALNALSAEIHLDALIGRLLHLALENAGAERGWLLLDREGTWYVEASLASAAPETLDRPSLPWTAVPLPAAILRYAARTCESVVLDDAARAGPFTHDEYVQAHRPCSLACIPLVNQGRILGLLYLENNLAVGVFTAARCQILQFLAAQAAVSLAISLLYRQLADHNRSLELRVDERTGALQQALDQLRRAQRQMVESEKLAALGGLVAGIAHEINTPVGIGVTAASALADATHEIQRAYAGGRMTREDFDLYLDRAQRASQILLANLGRAVNLIQSFKQIAVDQSSEAPRSFLVGEYLEQVVLSLQPERRRVPHRVEIVGDPTLTLHSHPGAMAQIITNLVMNSLQHAWREPGPGPGTIHIAFACHDRCFELRYSDDGQGIAGEHLGRIFEPFFTTRRDHGGSGLGLYIVYNITTQRLQGTITCESAPGQGACFRLTMPATQVDPDSPTQQRSTA